MRAKMARSLIYLITAVISISIAGTANSQLYCYETDRLKLLYFGKGYAYLVPHVVACYENALNYHQELFDFKPTEKITLFLHDFNDYNNAGASTAPFNKITLAIAPASYVFETTPANERINATMNHELVHIAAADKASGSDKFFRTLFWGKVKETSDNPLTILYSYLTSPRRSASRWYHEGIAVFMETWMAGGYGRAQGPWDEMVFRTKVRDSSRIYDLVGLESEASKVDFQVGVNAYLYGTRFMSYLTYEYGPEKLIAWINRSSGSSAYYISQFKKVYGIPMGDAWQNWIDWEHIFQERNLKFIREYPLTNSRPLAKKGMGSVSTAFYDEELGELIVAVNYPGQIPHITAINLETRKSRRLTGVKGPALYFVTSTAYDKNSKTLFYTTDNNGWRDIVSLDVKSGKKKMLLKDARIGDLSFCSADSSLWGVRHSYGISAIVRIPYPYDEWNLVYAWPYGSDVYDIDISSDGKQLTSGLAEINGRQSLIMMDVNTLLTGDTCYSTLFDFGNSIAANFVFSEDNKYLYGASYYTGVSNIFRYDLANDSMEALSNCESGYFRPTLYQNDSLIVFEYTGDGFLPIAIEEKVIEDVNPISYLGHELTEMYPLLKEWILEPPSAVDIDTIKADTSAYHSFWHIGLASAYPIIEGYGDYAAWGVRMNFQSPANLHNTYFTVSYSPQQSLAENERLHLNWFYRHSGWEISFDYNGADFYDLFGPTKTSRKGNSLGLTYTKTLIYDSPKHLNLKFDLKGFNNLEILPDFQNVSTSSDKFLIGSISLNYSRQVASLGAVDYEKGIGFQLVTSHTYVSDQWFPRVFANLHLGAPLPLNHSSIWLRTSAGYADGDKFEPFANFYFGSFGNNYVDHQSVKRYRSHLSFPGLELNEASGNNYFKTLLEWSLPPIRFRSLGSPSLYASWLRIAVFTTFLYTDFDNDEFKSRIGNVGAQLDLRLSMLSRLSLTVSAGYARAFEKGYRPADEFMVSVKL